MTRRLARLAAAVLVTAAAGLTVLGASAPASAATCSTASGVTVLVDFKQLGGGIQGACVAGGAGQSAASLFSTTGFPLDYVSSVPGFVCRVSGLPTATEEACNNTPPTTAYWGLWWSDGKTGTWSYSNYGVSALKVPNGGYVAFAWKAGDGPASAPGVAPIAHPGATTSATPSATPTKTPSPSPTKSPTRSPSTNPSTTSPTSSAETTSASPTTTSSSATESASTSESATESATPTDTATPSATETPTATESSGGPVVQDPADPVDSSAVEESDGGVPILVVLLVIALLFGGSAAAVVVRRRRT